MIRSELCFLKTKPGFGVTCAVLWTAVIAGAGQKDYKHLVGQSTKICGRVVTYTKEGKECAVRLDLGRPYWDPAFYVVVPEGARTQFTPSPEDALLFQDICVTGLVEAGKDGVPHIVANSASQVEITIKREVTPFGAGVARPCGPVKPPKALKLAKPNYSPDGLAKRIEGLVLLDAIIGIDGKVTDMRVVFGLLDSLDREAQKAIKKWRFEASTIDGVPVPTIVQIEMSFSLRK